MPSPQDRLARAKARPIKPQPNRIYSGSAVPSTYDPSWQYFTNLTKDQIAWFQAQPEWQNFLDYAAMAPTAVQAGMSPATVNAGLASIAVAKPLVP